MRTGGDVIMAAKSNQVDEVDKISSGICDALIALNSNNGSKFEENAVSVEPAFCLYMECQPDSIQNCNASHLNVEAAETSACKKQLASSDSQTITLLSPEIDKLDEQVKEGAPSSTDGRGCVDDDKTRFVVELNSKGWRATSNFQSNQTATDISQIAREGNEKSNSATTDHAYSVVGDKRDPPLICERNENETHISGDVADIAVGENQSSSTEDTASLYENFNNGNSPFVIKCDVDDVINLAL